MKKGILIAAVAFLAGEAFAQKADLTSAILSYRKQDMPTAMKYIDQADIKLSEGGTLKAKDLSKYYYNRGLIYTKVFTDIQEKNKDEAFIINYDINKIFTDIQEKNKDLIINYNIGDSKTSETYQMVISGNDVTINDSKNIQVSDISNEIYLVEEAINAFNSDLEPKGSAYGKKSNIELQRILYALNNLAYDRYELNDYVSALYLFEKIVDVNASNAIGKVDTSNIYNASLMAV